MRRRDRTVEMKRVFMMLAEGRKRTKKRVEVSFSILLTSAWKTENRYFFYEEMRRTRLTL